MKTNISAEGLDYKPMLEYLKAYVKGVQVSRKKGMIETQSGKIDVLCRNIGNIKAKTELRHLKAIRVKDGVLEIAHSNRYDKKYTPEDFKNKENWESMNPENLNIVFVPTIVNIVGQVTDF